MSHLQKLGNLAAFANVAVVIATSAVAPLLIDRHVALDQQSRFVGQQRSCQRGTWRCRQ
jgi:hypothetical protein